jgi:RimJ/RimL family protein N-acetyltransferase
MFISYREVSLRQVLEDDLPFLFRLFVDPTRCHLWMANRQVYDERGFHEAWLSWTGSMMGAKFIVETGGRPIGLVFEYHRALEDGYTKVSALLDEESVGRGSGVIAAALLVDWLFGSLPLRKVYMDVYGYNPRVVGLLRKLGLLEEAVLKEARFWNGSYWDVHMFSISRGGWPEVRDRILKLERQVSRAPGAPPEPTRKEMLTGELAVQVNGCPSCVGSGAGPHEVARFGVPFQEEV